MKIVIMYVGDRLTIHFLLKNPRVSKKQQVKHPHLYCSGLVFETFFSIIENKYKFAFFTGNVFEARKFVRKVPQIDKQARQKIYDSFLSTQIFLLSHISKFIATQGVFLEENIQSAQNENVSRDSKVNEKDENYQSGYYRLLNWVCFLVQRHCFENHA